MRDAPVAASLAGAGCADMLRLVLRTQPRSLGCGLSALCFRGSPVLMPDVFTKAKRSDVMSRIRGPGNKDTELTLMRVFRAQGITGWRRHVEVKVKKQSTSPQPHEPPVRCPPFRVPQMRNHAEAWTPNRVAPVQGFKARYPFSANSLPVRGGEGEAKLISRLRRFLGVSHPRPQGRASRSSPS